ncbi:uncharacterized protein RSE6_11890 [Rhynchosporium secalis]|uniref:Chromo domain-containing protein n=1 Tax=Rhynchosporium secalis TaxID=38038 RepID=A0A1E1MP04_RHYSE|nr:uncharacterized protein RSE6_11890 [Rhynchosporium secalis]
MYGRDVLSRRIGEASRTPKRRRSKSPDSSNTTPSSSARPSAGKKAHVKQKVVEEASQEYFSARSILEEETRKGKVYYLIDWEDSKVTGIPYEPTWEPFNFATPSLIAEWQNRNLGDQRQKRAAAAVEVESPRGRGRPAKRRRLVRKADISEERSRVATGESETDQEDSRTATQGSGLKRLKREIPDSYEEEVDHPTSSNVEVAVEQARIEIVLPRDFDSGEYIAYNISSSREASSEPQESHHLDLVSSDSFKSSEPSQNYELSKVTSASSKPAQSLQFSSAPETQPRQLSQTNFIWDEDIAEDSSTERPKSQTPTLDTGGISSDPIESSAPAAQTSQPYIWDSDVDDEEFENENHDNDPTAFLEIPDSQGPDSSSYKPTATIASKTTSSTDSTALHNSQNNTESSLEAIDFRNTQLVSSSSNQQESGSTESQFAQPASILEQESPIEPPAPTFAQVASTQFSEAHSSIPHIINSSAAQRFFSGPPDARVRASPPGWPVFRSQDSLTTARLESPQRFGQRLDQASEESSGFQTQLPHFSSEEESSSELSGSAAETDERGEEDDIEVHIELGLEIGALEQPPVEAEESEEDSQPNYNSELQILAPAAPVVSINNIEDQIDSNKEVISSALVPREGQDHDSEAQLDFSLEVQLSISPADEVQDHNIEDQLDTSVAVSPPELATEELDSDIEKLDPNLEIYFSTSFAKKLPSAKASSEQHSEPRSLSNFTDWQASRILSRNQIRTQVTKSIQSSPSQSQSHTKVTQEDSIQLDSLHKSSPEPATGEVINTQVSFSSKGSGFSEASSHLPSPPIEDSELQPTIEGAEPLDSRLPSEPSRPSKRRRKRTLSSSMEPPNEPIASAPRMDPTAVLKAKMAARKAERECEHASSIFSKSPTPALQITNIDAMASNATVIMPNSVVPLQPQVPGIPTSGSSAITGPIINVPIPQPLDLMHSVPPITSTRAASVNTGPVEAPAPSPQFIEDTGPYEEEDEDEDEEEEGSTSIKPLPLSREIYEVPLSMTSYTRSVYVARIKIYKVQLQSFLRNEVPDERLVTEVRSLLETLQTVCIDPGILDEDPTQQDDHEMQAKWAENVSTKFIFLAEFLELMKATGDHIIIVAQPGQVIDELESLLIYHHIDYSRADRRRRPLVAGQLRVTIYPVGAQRYDVDPTSLVIGFDSSYHLVPYLEEIRTRSTSPGLLAPLISLPVTNSVEHIERCFDSNLEDSRRLIKVASCIQQLMEKVGTWQQEGYYDPPDAAAITAQYMKTRPRDRIWPILPLPAIDGLDLGLLSSQGYSEAQTQPPTQPGKRQLDVDKPLDAEVLKRPRLTSFDAVSNGKADSSASAPEVSGDLVDSSVFEATPVSPQQRIAELESRLLEREATETTLREINNDLESRCKSFEDSIATIQPKYQEALNDRGKYEYDNVNLLKREAELNSKCDSKDVAIRKLREKLAAVEAELFAAQSALATSSIPEIAKFESLREELANSKLEIEREKKRHANTNRDLDYLRETYQTSSSSAAEHQRIVQALEAEVLVFREKATQDVVRVHEIQKLDENAELRRENINLKARLKDMARDLEKKQEELQAAATNGRRSMRGASMPRSPRIGAGHQGSSSGRPSGRSMYGAGSRGTSPAPKDGRAGNAAAHAANANVGADQFADGTFGDALFSNPAPRPVPQKERWGDHLQ